jgi:hypothetical protein
MANTSSFNPDQGYLGAGVGGAIGGLFAPNAFDASKPYFNNASGDINNYYRQAVGFLNPYMQQGQQAMGQYSSMLGNMSNPTQFYNNVMSGFQMTPAQQYAQQQGMNAISNNAAVRGLMGSTEQARNLENYGQMSTQQAQQQYLNNILGINSQALSGFGDLTRLGYGAASTAGQFGMQAGQEDADIQEAMAQAAAANAAQQGQGFGSLGGAFGALAGFGKF